MEFLVNIQVLWPPDGDPERFASLVVAERRRAAELAEEGTLVRLWRVPGRMENWGLWQAPDATALHTAIMSLPLASWLDVLVIPLAEHPSDPEVGGGY